MDPDLTRQTRKALIDRLEREQILIAAGHFEAPGYGRIVAPGRAPLLEGTLSRSG